MARNNASGRLDSSGVLPVVEQFELAWKNGARPDLALFLPTAAPDPAVLLPLVHLDLEYRLKADDQARVEDYLSRFPVLGQDDSAVLRLIVAEYQLRRRREPDLQWSEYCIRFPKFGSELIKGTSPGYPSPETNAGEACSSLFPHFSGEPAPIPYLPGLARQSAQPVAAPFSIPGYEVQGILGQGGMGIVCKARSLQLDRQVAIKMIRTGAGARPEELERFQSEARAVARLQHPHIVQIFEVGETQGQPFFCLEFVEGGSLAGKLSATPQPTRESALLVRTLAGAIAHAHRHGIVHRDLKPANVLLTATGEPKITDFGLAKRLDVEEHTVSGLILGTPCYMAPEQAAGRNREIGPPADVWALGAILYEMLTGRPPFKGTSSWTTIEQVLHAEPVTPSQFQAAIPRDIETICLKCLQKEPSRRYGSALELADDLKRFLDGEPIRARRAGLGERLVKWARRKPFQAATFVAVLLLLGTGGFAALAQNRYLQSELNARKAIEDQGVNGKLLIASKQWPQAQTALETAIDTVKTRLQTQASEVLAELEEDLRFVKQQIKDQDDRQQASTRFGKLQKSRGKAVFDQFPLTITTTDWAESRVRFRIYLQEALAIYFPDGGKELAGRLTEALDRERQLLEPAEFAQLTAAWYELLLIWAGVEAGPPQGEDRWRLAKITEQSRQDGERALVLLDQADRLRRAYRLVDTQIYYQRRARYLALSRGEPFDPRIDPAAPPKPTGALDWFLQGLESYQAEKYNEASKDCIEVLALEKDHFWAHYLSGLCHLRAGRWREAKVDFTACRAQREDFPWPLLLRGFAASEQGARSNEDAAIWKKQEGDLARENARKHEQDARDEFTSSRNDLDLALSQKLDATARYTALTNRGVLSIRQGRWDEAIADLETAVRENPADYRAYVNLAQAHEGAGQGKKALRVMNQALERAPRQPEMGPFVAELYRVRARMHQQQNDLKAARADLERAVALEPKDSKSRKLADNLVELGQLLSAEGKEQEALTRFERALQVRPELVLVERFRAESLLALERNDEAAQALDRYLAASQKPVPEVYKTRGILYARTGKLAPAIDTYGAALRLNPNDVQTRALRGWAYLVSDAVQLALEDFEVCVTKKPDSADYRIGRASARIRLKQRQEALADAGAAEKQGGLTARLLYQLSCVYAQAAAQTELEVRSGQTRLGAQWVTHYEERAQDCLRRSLEALPEAKRQPFWRGQVQTDPLLTPIRRGRSYLQLAAIYGSRREP